MASSCRRLPLLGLTILVGICVVLGFILLVIPGIILVCMFYVAVPANVVERNGLTRAMSRSAFLTKGHRWGILGLIVLLALAGGIFGNIVERVVVDHIDVNGTDVINPDDWNLYVLVSFTVQVITGAIGATMAAVSYVFLRNEKDSVGVGELARVFE